LFLKLNERKVKQKTPKPPAQELEAKLSKKKNETTSTIQLN